MSMTEPKGNSSPRKRRWFQCSLRTLVVFVLLAGVATVLAMKVERAWQQQVAVEAIKRAGGAIHSVPDDGFFSTVIGVWGRVRPDPSLDKHEVQRLKNMGLCKTVTDAEMECVGRLSQLKKLDLEGCEITNAGLKYFKGLSQLETLDVRNTHVTDNEVADLQRALPNCKISR